MQDIYLAFQDEAESLPILYTIVPTEYELGKTGKPTKTVKTESYMTPNYQNISVIGTVYQRPTKPILMDEDYVPVPYPPPNYGVNIRLLDDEDIEPLRPYMVYPTNPIRVWA
jgi:hypothetical protein